MPSLLRPFFFTHFPTLLLCTLTFGFGAKLRAQDDWFLVPPVTGQNLWSVASDGSTFVAAGENGTVLTSSDGLAWTSRNSGTDRWLVGASHGNGRFVIVGDQGTILTSPDGIVWSSRVSGTTARLNGVAFGGGRWLVVAESGEVLSSVDAFSWTKLQPSSDRLRGLTYAYGQFVITGDNGLMRTTVDTLDYDVKLLPEGLFVESVVHARRNFLAVGASGYAVVSPDAVTWTRVATGTASYLRGVTFFNGQFVAVGDSGTVITTPAAGSPWTPRPTGTTVVLTAVTADDSAVIAVGFNGTILRSTPKPAAPAIAVPPLNILAQAGDNVLFEVAATGSPPLRYQWSHNEQPLPGATSDRLLLPNVQGANSGAYRVQVTNSAGSVASIPASLTLATSTAPDPIVDSTFTPTLTFSAPIVAAVEQADGKVIIGGSQFFITPGVSPFALARLNVDGSLDTSFNLGSGFNGGATLSALALQPDGRLLVAGTFNSFNGTARNHLLRLNPDGSLDLTFSPASEATSMAASQLTVQPDGKLLVLSNGRLYRLKSDGAVDPAFAGPSSGVQPTVHALLPNGKILLNDHNPSLPFFPRRPLRRLNADGTIDPTFVPISAPDFDLDNGRFEAVFALPDGTALAHTYLYRRGLISEALRRLDASGAPDLTWGGLYASGYSSNTLSTVFAPTPDGKIFQSNRGEGVLQTTALRRWNANATLDYSFNARASANGVITGILPLRDGRTLILGDFTTFDHVARPRLVRLVAANALAVQPPIIVSATPEAVAVRPGEPVTITVLAAGSGPLTYLTTVGNPPTPINGGATVSVPTNVSGNYDVVVSVTNRAGSVTTAPIRVVVAPSAPILSTQPQSTVARVGGSAVLSVTAAGTSPITYEWFRNGERVGTNATLSFTNLTTSQSGDYTVVVRNSLGVTTSQVARLTVDDSARLANISTRALVMPGEQTLIAGFVVSGPGKMNLLIRGAGPALTTFGLAGLLPDPVITLHDAAGRSVATNDNWSTAETPLSLFSSVGAFPFLAASADSAVRVSLDPGSYTLHVADGANRAGIALAEIYESGGAAARLANLSSRAFVGTGANIAISGIVIQGQQAGRFLIRGVGPGLSAFGVVGELPDPVIALTTAAGITVASNDNWATNTNAADIAAAAVQVGAFPFATGSGDAALLVTLPPGNYTALMSGANNTSGVGLIEIYEVP